LLLGLLVPSCAGRYDVKSSMIASKKFDAVIVLGCPSKDDGSPTLCQLGRALQASLLWDQGVVQHFITSGGAVHTPYVEAEAIAQLMVAAGVPPDRIYLDPNALHTDENVYNGLQIAKKQGWKELAILSDRGHSSFGCEFMTSFGERCAALSVDRDAVKARHQQLHERIQPLRAPRDPEYITLAERERRIYEQTGRRRPPSFLLYPQIAIMRSNGERWTPHAPAEPPILCYADKLTKD
jgi:hypothetical protein